MEYSRASRPPPAGDSVALKYYVPENLLKEAEGDDGRMTVDDFVARLVLECSGSDDGTLRSPIMVVPPVRPVGAAAPTYTDAPGRRKTYWGDGAFTAGGDGAADGSSAANRPAMGGESGQRLLLAPRSESKAAATAHGGKKAVSWSAKARAPRAPRRALADQKLTSVAAAGLGVADRQFVAWRSSLRRPDRELFKRGQKERSGAGVPLLRQKTMMCPRDGCTGRSGSNPCKFAHTAEELRPRPRIETYKSQPCTDVGLSGHNACSFGEMCNYVHPNEPLRYPYRAEPSRSLVVTSAKGSKFSSYEYFDKDYYDALAGMYGEDVSYPYGIFV